LITFQAFADQDEGNGSAQVPAARCLVAIGRVSARTGLDNQAAASFHKALARSERFVKGSTATPDLRQVAAEAYAGLGNLASARGANSALPADLRISEWNEGRSYYLQSVGLWKSIGKPVTNAPGDGYTDSFTRVAARIVDCDKQLARLRGLSASTQRP
jgi:hypothetical protein